MFDLINIFEVFLPQLLLYPNASDPLNPEAASLMLKDQDGYKKKVLDFVSKYGIQKKKTDSESTIIDELQNSDTEK